MTDLNDWINRLPEPQRSFVIGLETLCDPAGVVQENVFLREQNQSLRTLVSTIQEANQELRALLAKCRRGENHD